MSSGIVTRTAVAIQSAKGTPATTGFHVMRNARSSVLPMFEYEDALNEHTGVHSRASSRQSVPDRIGQRLNLDISGLLYPNAIGTLLTGIGLNASTTDQTTYKSHAFTKANTDAAKYLSVMQKLLAGGAAFERKVQDVRLTQLQLAATKQNISISAQGLGIDEANSAGTETVASETNERIISPTGSLSFGSLALGNPRSHTITITRPVDEDDQKQHGFLRADLPETGFAVDGEMMELDLSLSLYNKLNRGGAGGTALSSVAVTDSLTVKWESARVISGAIVPYSIQFAFTKAVFRFTNAEANGEGIVRCDLNYSMIDDVSGAPLTVTLANGVAAYS